MSRYFIRPLEQKDNADVRYIIKTVMPEYGADGAGFAINDPEVDSMFETYSQPRHSFFVVTDGEKVYGGGGIAPLAGAEATLCELRKMYFLPGVRGLGLGQKLLNSCLQSAREMMYEKCYLETLKAMKTAQILYRKSGFIELEAPLGETGHFSCDSWYLKIL